MCHLCVCPVHWEPQSHPGQRALPGNGKHQRTPVCCSVPNPASSAGPPPRGGWNPAGPAPTAGRPRGAAGHSAASPNPCPVPRLCPCFPLLPPPARAAAEPGEEDGGSSGTKAGGAAGGPVGGSRSRARPRAGRTLMAVVPGTAPRCSEAARRSSGEQCPLPGKPTAWLP